MKSISKISLLLSTIFATTANAAGKNLRSTTSTTRKLQVSTVLDALITKFTPALFDSIQNRLYETVDPIFIGKETTLETGVFDVPFPSNGIGQNNNLCNASASVTYGLGEVWGLSSVYINRLELVPGSEGIEMSRFGLEELAGMVPGYSMLPMPT
jgi:hypothetical protein